MSDAGKGRKAVEKNRKAKGYVLAEPITEGTEVVDTQKKVWKIGPVIGSGGFGTIYFAAEAGKAGFDYVVKIEPHGNGPLFAEIHCYQNIGKPTQLTNWVKEKKIPYLGLSPCYGFGSFDQSGAKYRFMIIERFGTDLQKLFEENGKKFPLETVCKIGISMLDVLEYMHTNGYIHGDIKPANLLLGRKQGSENQIYLVDMGLACKYLRDKVHKKDAPDPKKAHNGTIEFASRDAHRGCFSRRSDMEILCYNIIYLLNGELPWEKYVPDNNKVAREKEKYMNDVDGLLKMMFGDDCPANIKKLVVFVSQLGFEETPDYEFCRQLLKDMLKKKNDNILVFAERSNKQKGKETEELSGRVRKSPRTVYDGKENVAEPVEIKKRRKAEQASEYNLEPGCVPTPAMIAVMEKKAGAKSAKPVKDWKA